MRKYSNLVYRSVGWRSHRSMSSDTVFSHKNVGMDMSIQQAKFEKAREMSDSVPLVDTVKGFLFGAVCDIRDSPYRIFKLDEKSFWKGRSEDREAQAPRIWVYVSRAQNLLTHIVEVLSTRQRTNLMEKCLSAKEEKKPLKNTPYRRIMSMDSRDIIRWASQRVVPRSMAQPMAISKLFHKFDVRLFFRRLNSDLDAEKGAWLLAAEAGDLDDFKRLYLADTSRLKYTDSKGKAAVHYAASKNHVHILNFIIDHAGDMNVQDSLGNTALHYAVENNALQALACLLGRGANSSIINNEQFGPIHLATQLNRIEILEEIVKFKGKVETCLRSKHGRTALHLAAIYDHAECAKILLRGLGCCPRQTCENGYYPIHEAARNASANALQALLEFGQTLGCNNQQMMKLFDADGNVPLHSAVHAGDIKAVKMCLEWGAVISTQQHDLSTPAHLACAQGAMDIVQLMFDSQPQEKTKCLAIKDAQNMTPLHHAAMFNHPELVEYLVAQGAQTDAVDKDGRSVLLLAGARAAWKAVIMLIRLGADVTHRDQCFRNILHHIVLSGGNLDNFTPEIPKFNIERLLNERDIFGCSPIHYASRDGHLKTIQSLIQLGALINLKNNENQSPLHFAAKYGRYNTVKHLLESHKGHLIINEMDGEGMSALHIASESGHTKVVQLLLVKGALLHRDHKGRTPLHYAAGNGYTKTMHQLILVHSHLLDQCDREGNTPIHLCVINNKGNAASLLLSLNCKIKKNGQGMSPLDYALHYKHSEVAHAMVMHPTRGEEIIRTETKKYNCLIEGLAANMPDVMMAVLDRGITKSAEQSEDSKQYFIKYDFRALESLCVTEGESGQTPLPFMNLMIRYRREELMSHPLCMKYLETKWNAYGMYFHLINLAIYTVFLAALTIASIELMSPENSSLYNRSSFGADPVGGYNFTRVMPHTNRSLMACLASSVVLVFTIVSFLKEICQMYQQRERYLKGWLNAIEWLLYITSTVTALEAFYPYVLHPATTHIIAAIAVFCAWFNYLLYLQRFNSFGIYVVMFLEILSTLVHVLFVFSVLIIAFGLSFYILMAKIEGQHEKGFYSPSISMMRVSTMMLGELDFLSTFLQPLKKLQGEENYHFWQQMAAANWFLVMFAVLMPILLMNLLIGLAVGDIETVRRNASMKRLTMQVEMHTNLERRLPKQLLNCVGKAEIYEYPNKKCKATYVWSMMQRVFVSQGDDHRHTQASWCKPATIPVEGTGADLPFELHKQRKRLRELSKSMNQQLQLIRLIVQKMEIKTEGFCEFSEVDCDRELDFCGEPTPLSRVHQL